MPNVPTLENGHCCQSSNRKEPRRAQPLRYPGGRKKRKTRKIPWNQRELKKILAKSRKSPGNVAEVVSRFRDVFFGTLSHQEFVAQKSWMHSKPRSMRSIFNILSIESLTNSVDTDQTSQIITTSSLMQFEPLKTLCSTRFFTLPTVPALATENSSTIPSTTRMKSLVQKGCKNPDFGKTFSNGKGW